MDSAASHGGEPVALSSRHQALRTVWLSDIHLGLARMPRESAARLPAPHALRAALPRRRHHRPRESAQELLLAREPHRSAATAPEEEPGRHAHRLPARQSRSRPARARGREIRQHRDRARTRSTRRAAAAGCSSRTAISSTPSCAGRSLGVWLGGFACRRLLTLNRFVHWLHDVLGRPYWSLAQHVKARFPGAQALHRALPATRRSLLRAKRASTASSAATFTAPTVTEIDGLTLLQRRRLGRELHGARRRPARRAVAARVAADGRDDRRFGRVGFSLGRDDRRRRVGTGSRLKAGTDLLICPLGAHRYGCVGSMLRIAAIFHAAPSRRSTIDVSMR